MDNAVGTRGTDTLTFTDHISPTDLITALYEYRPKIQVLSLDCFDTILWRKTAAPTDVMYDLQNSPGYTACNITSVQRISAEVSARYNKLIRLGTPEVTIQDIYEIGLPALTPSEIELLIEEEIQAEINTCYAFPPIVEMIRHAKMLGLKVIIVSNTYLTNPQLNRLLKNALPQDVYQGIDHVFCSCEYGDSKAGLLFQYALKKLSITPSQVLHIGDNYAVDFEKPKASGMHGLHLVQLNPALSELNRLQTIASSISIPDLRHKRGLPSPFHGVFSTYTPNVDEAETSIGYTSLGPIFYAFANTIKDTISALQKNGRSPKVLFLMRDGYLPFMVCRELFDCEIGKQARISRFSSVAASFRTKTDVEKFLAEYFTILSAEYICKQLLVSPELTKQLIDKATLSKSPKYTFCQLLLQEPVLKEIFEKSAQYRHRLIQYLHKTANLQPGDTLLFVDIGYAGTAQNALSPILQDELGLAPIHGCYLMFLNMHNWKKSFHGLITPAWCDDRIMNLIGSDVSLLEQFCSSCDDSVIDYTDDGEPIFLKSAINQDQVNKIRKVQNECLRFISDTKAFFEQANLHFTHEQLRDHALAELTRLLYLPTEKEVEYLQGFSHDKNKGFQDSFEIYGQIKNELSKLRQHGLLFKDEHPHTLRAATMEMSLSIMAKRRFGLHVNLDDRSFQQEWINVILLKDDKQINYTCNAKYTYDGYFALCLPIDAHCSQVAIIFGTHYQLVQVEKIALIEKDAFLTNHEHFATLDLTNQISLNEMRNRGNNLFECETNHAAILISIPPHAKQAVFRVTFRPVGKI